MTDMSKLGKDDASGPLYSGGVGVLGIGAISSVLLYLIGLGPGPVAMVATLACAIGLGLMILGMNRRIVLLTSQMQGLLQSVSDMGRTVQIAAIGEEKMEQAMKQDAQQMLSSITSYIEMEMWVEAAKKAEELVAKYPKSEEAKKVKPNLEHIKSKATAKPAAKPAAAAKPQQPAAPAKK